MDQEITPAPQPKIRTHYFHLSNKVGLTLVSRQVKEMPGSVKVGMALTHPNDRGTRREGYQIARSRLEGEDSAGPGLHYCSKDEIIIAIKALRNAELYSDNNKNLRLWFKDIFFDGIQALL